MKSLLIVDDAGTIRALIKVFLSGRNLRYYEANNGAEGLEVTLRHRPTAIIADLRMPEMDGMDFCREVRNAPDAEVRRIPIVLLTAAKEEGLQAQAMAAGATHFLAKPIDGPRLATLVEALLRGAR